MKDFRKMQVWHKGHKLALEIYNLTAKFDASVKTSLPTRFCSVGTVSAPFFGLLAVASNSQKKKKFMDCPARLEGLPFPYRLISLKVAEEEALKS